MSQFFKRVQRFAKKSPIAAGIPFMGMIVAASYGFSYITQVKYDYIDAKYTTSDPIVSILVHQSEKREKLGLKNAEPIDIRKIYFDLAKDDDDWDFVRVPRQPGEK
ncbi:hypothetical protein BATDEDRAFT_90603 [Batrachochytrium dendrobatidis JAM81]|uniref:Cytochrome c oxidase assembly protein COX16, mitochondrial n=2 Tax=Batrachochytrium dendrobatidis TaxID=109871 RepID=F4P7L1_BATDJ|nr:uncharacterized protein BATDEDRAFT_90603 [Batrachochytrium dendrobatidis JAM81]EGF78624.1 hypothetical protein BATDEDRAFT_90603 [Batrachochytrium dendrobatidis JAM81]OAJ43442.1 hypothetical protein BDEG_26802 [Batrachochytrium dendrobatidis JEL423]|eukprot:XP_006680915.1 hypothetical protein BATDEDRAFT_90603 [Batrachochytrium dendrobatidis JAM81]